MQGTTPSPLGLSPGRIGPSHNKTFSPADIRDQGEDIKRLKAAQFINERVAGARVPYHSDEAFRGALKDGRILCHLLNGLRPGTVLYIHDEPFPETPTQGTITTFENVCNFLEAVKTFTDDYFSAEDLIAPGNKCVTH
jgi:hypothetical protein